MNVDMCWIKSMHQYHYFINNWFNHWRMQYLFWVFEQVSEILCKPIKIRLSLNVCVKFNVSILFLITVDMLISSVSVVKQTPFVGKILIKSDFCWLFVPGCSWYQWMLRGRRHWTVDSGHWTWSLGVIRGRVRCQVFIYKESEKFYSNNQ